MSQYRRKNPADYHPIPGAVISVQSIKVTKEYCPPIKKPGKVNYLNKQNINSHKTTDGNVIIKKEIIHHGKAIYIGGEGKIAAFVWIDENTDQVV